jgi:L-alanine-DL-glutamate epimerase-like enolase superfamily enzyme
MKIAALTCETLRVPTGVAVSASIGSFDAVSYLLLTLHSDEGLQGTSHIQVPGEFGLKALQALLDDFRGLVLGRDPRDTDGLAEMAWKSAFWLGPSGLWAFVSSALDMACWDLAGQAAGQPLHRLWGSRRDAVDVYGSGRMWLAQPIEAIVEEARGFAEQGFHAVKMRIGSPDPARDVERVAAVRAALGPKIALMVDCNQGLDLARATRLAGQLQAYELAWIEEPLPFDDVRGHAELRRRIGIPVATGENLYLPQEFRQYMEQGAADVLMPDLQRCGGYSGMNRIAGEAAAHGIRISPHAYAWHSTHCVAAHDNAGPVEYMPRGDALFGRTTRLRAGLLPLPQAAGTGLRYDPGFIAKHRVTPTAPDSPPAGATH